MDKPKREDRYIQFPLCMLQKTFEDPEKGLNLIINFGIVNYSQKFSYDISEVGRQLMYAYYRNQGMIQADLLKTMERYIDSEQLSIDEDYNGFSGTSFDPLEDSELLSLFESDTKFKDAAIIRYQISQAAESLDVKINSIDSVIQGHQKGLKIKDSRSICYIKFSLLR